MQAANPHELEGVQFVRNKESSNEQRQSKGNKILSDSGWMSRFQRKSNEEEPGNGAPEQTDTCPYCNSQVQAGIKFCVNCNHQLTGPVGAYSATRPNRVDGQAKGFSSKAKVAMSKSNPLGNLQKVLTLIFLLLLVYGVWTAWNNPALVSTISKMVAHVEKK